MKPVELKPRIYWVGGIDWHLRNFHGYMTQRGTTYNAYLILDEKVVLVDTVKHYLFDEMLARIRAVIDPAKIDYLVSNHVEMDHSGSLAKLVALAPKAKVVTSPNGAKGLRRHYKQDWDPLVVKSGDTLPIGKRTLQFFLTPMVHWPDNMVTYIPEEKLLLPNDAFGQHVATPERFDDELCWDILHEEAAKYYANIVLPYGEQVQKALEALAGLPIEMIAPSHGVIWRKHLPKLLAAYQRWAANDTDARAVIVYDTMWGSTEKLAYSLLEGLEDQGIPVTLRNLRTIHISDVMTDLLTAKAILIGSPTLNMGMLPTVGAFSTYLKGLKPKRRIGFAFGSYGWAGQSVKELEGVMRGLGWDIPVEGVSVQYIPDEAELQKMRAIGNQLGELLKSEKH